MLLLGQNAAGSCIEDVGLHGMMEKFRGCERWPKTGSSLPASSAPFMFAPVSQPIRLDMLVGLHDVLWLAWPFLADRAGYGFATP
jgi:hypothetical protein